MSLSLNENVRSCPSKCLFFGGPGILYNKPKDKNLWIDVGERNKSGIFVLCCYQPEQECYQIGRSRNGFATFRLLPADPLHSLIV